MQEFEIRVLRDDGTPSIISTLRLFSTQAAVGATLRIARGRAFEVWCDDRCVYASILREGPTPPGTIAA
jgi:hypothetical protein